MVEANITKSSAKPIYDSEKEKINRLISSLKVIESSPEFMKAKEILKENQRLVSPNNPYNNKENSGYKALEEILTKVSDEKRR